MQIDLTQSEADALLRMNKFRVDNASHIFPDLGGHIEIALQSENHRESFSLDISRRRIALLAIPLQHHCALFHASVVINDSRLSTASSAKDVGQKFRSDMGRHL